MTQNSPLSKAYHNFPRFLLLPCVFLFTLTPEPETTQHYACTNPKPISIFPIPYCNCSHFKLYFPFSLSFSLHRPTTHHPQQQTPENQKNCDLTRSGYFLTNWGNGFWGNLRSAVIDSKLRARNRSNLPRKTSSLGTMGEEEKRRGASAGTEGEGLSPLPKAPFALQWRSKP